jgi:polyphosphate glucokinase
MSAMSILVVDIGGSNVKCMVSGGQPFRFASGAELTPARMLEGLRGSAQGLRYEGVSIGYPGVVKQGQIAREPVNLGPGWVGFDFERAMQRPVKTINDAAMQAMGCYEGGTMLFLGLGTGLGTTLIIEGTIAAMELGHLHSESGLTYEEELGAAGRRRQGDEQWAAKVRAVVDRFRRVFQPDYTVLGGGNASRVEPLPAQTRRAPKDAAFIGGFQLWAEGNRCAFR